MDYRGMKELLSTMDPEADPNTHKEFRDKVIFYKKL
jgi:hypothetical protein